MLYNPGMNEKKYFYSRVLADTNLYLTEFEGEDFRYGAQVVIESEFGQDLAYITSFTFRGSKDGSKEGSNHAKARFVRYADDKDRETAEHRLKESREARKEVTQIAADLGLKMNITHLLLPLKGNAMVVYYTAEGRVDFRELLKRARSRFKERIVMRQIGAKARLNSFAIDARIPMNKWRLSS